jgi:hypothetical protein
MKTRLVAAEMFQADKEERTDITKLIVTLHNFANSPIKCHSIVDTVSLRVPILLL